MILNRRGAAVAVAVLVGCGIGPLKLPADDAFALKGGERIVFFGDSITQGGQYITYVEAYLLTRFPDKRFTLINHGISSETISGTTEPDHWPKRPHALPRFTRDVAAWKPDRVVACFGMNDGNYFPFEEARFARYQDGVRTLIRRTRNEAHADLTLLTPPPFDPYRRVVSDPNATHFGYKFPAVDYDQTLEHYSRWLLTFRKEKMIVADVHSASVEHLRRRRQERVSFFLAGDAVHPNATGHWLMAQTLLRAWNAPALCAEARFDAKTLKVESGELRDLHRNGSEIEFTWRSPLPMPLDPEWDPRSIALEQVSDRLNRYRLTVSNLPATRYRLAARLADDREDACSEEFAHERFAKGLDLTSVPRFPTMTLSKQLLTLLSQHRRTVYDRWRAQLNPATASDVSSESLAAENEAEAKIRALSQPRDVLIRLIPVPGD